MSLKLYAHTYEGGVQREADKIVDRLLMLPLTEASQALALAKVLFEIRRPRAKPWKEELELPWYEREKVLSSNPYSTTKETE